MQKTRLRGAEAARLHASPSGLGIVPGMATGPFPNRIQVRCAPVPACANGFDVVGSAVAPAVCAAHLRPPAQRLRAGAQ